MIKQLIDKGKEQLTKDYDFFKLIKWKKQHDLESKLHNEHGHEHDHDDEAH